MMKRIDPSLSIDLQEYLDLTGYDSVEWVDSPSADGAEVAAERREQQGTDLLLEQSPASFVGTGSLSAELLFIGEEAEAAPGQQAGEDPAAELLAKMIQAMGYQTSEVYILSFAKGADGATWAAIQERIESIAPRAIVALGALASHSLLENELTISELRGKMWECKVGTLNVNLFPTFHPAYLLRKATHKKDVWEDLQKVIAFLKT